MEVILIDDVFELGRRGDVVKVADGYGRNYLIPKQLAVPANPGNLKMVEEQRLALAKKEVKNVEAAELLAQELGQIHILISRKSGETGVLFGSVTSKDVASVLEAGGINLDRRRLLLKQPIKNVGNYTIESRPHNDVEAKVLVSVLPEGDEAVAKIIPRGEESDKILEELEEKISEQEEASEDTEAEAPAN
jgi:large subunit ribosomal protein L9